MRFSALYILLSRITQNQENSDKTIWHKPIAVKIIEWADNIVPQHAAKQPVVMDKIHRKNIWADRYGQSRNNSGQTQTVGGV